MDTKFINAAREIVGKAINRNPDVALYGEKRIFYQPNFVVDFVNDLNDYLQNQFKNGDEMSEMIFNRNDKSLLEQRYGKIDRKDAIEIIRANKNKILSMLVNFTISKRQPSKNITAMNEMINNIVSICIEIDLLNRFITYGDKGSRDNYSGVQFSSQTKDGGSESNIEIEHIYITPSLFSGIVPYKRKINAREYNEVKHEVINNEAYLQDLFMEILGPNLDDETRQRDDLDILGADKDEPEQKDKDEDSDDPA